MSKHTDKRITAAKGGVTLAKGFSAGGVRAGIKTADKTDLGLVLSAEPCTAAGTFTTNKVRAATVEWCEGILPSNSIRAIVCNSGNANACTGTQGIKDTQEIASLISTSCSIPPKSVLIGSTGIIGHFMPMDKVRKAITPLAADVTADIKGGARFAHAIMTTDTCSKESAVSVKSGNRSYIIGGCCKGSGMIHPNMATMLCYITSDVSIDKKVLQPIVKRIVDRTFNNLTVDGDTSTNDMVLVLCNGASGVRASSAPDLGLFESALFEVCNSLCAKIAQDGEGATKRIEIHVTGGKTYQDAKLAAKAISNSNLVKTAIYGNDPNWGRILCAIGYSGATFAPGKIKVSICGVPVFKAMQPVKFPVEKVRKLLAKKVVTIDAELGLGEAAAIAHTCDLTYDYIKINAEYHT